MTTPPGMEVHVVSLSWKESSHVSLTFLYLQTSPGPAVDSDKKQSEEVRRLQQTVESLKQENNHLKVTSLI